MPYSSVTFYARLVLVVVVLTLVITALVGEGSLYKLMHDVASTIWAANGNGSPRL